ncbi:MAG: DUF6702 family protein [Thermaurantimonas sp.]
MTALVVLYTVLVKVAIHDFYVSICTVRLSMEKVEFAVKVFKDDLEKAISLDYELIEDNPEKAYRYFSENLIFYTEKYLVHTNFTALKDLGESVLISGVAHTNGQNIVRIRNTIFCDVFPRQQNIMHVYSGDKVKTLLSDARRPMVNLL